MSRALAPPSAAELWVARRIVGPSELLGVHTNEGAKLAASRITSSMRTIAGGGEMVSVTGPRVEYRHPEHGEGTVTIRRLLQIALLLHTNEKQQRVRASYRLYIDTGNQRPLDAASAAWWIEKPNEPFAAALCAVYACRSAAELAEAREDYVEVWAAEHDALSALRADEIVDALRARDERERGRKVS